MITGWKAVKKTKKRNVFCTGGKCGSSYTEFKVGETYEVGGDPVLCSSGFHYYREQDFVFGLTLFGSNTCFIEIEVLGSVVFDTEKRVTNKLRVIRYIPVKEWRKLVKKNSNSGYWNSGYWNSGDSNSGHRNSGDRNSGNSNSGNRNSGNRNSGNRNSGHSNSGESNSGHSNSGHSNSGDSNSGHWNSGHWNSGDSNSGDRNSGDWNSCNCETGFFNSKISKTIRVFNVEIDRDIWVNCKKPNFIYFDLIGGKTYKECFKASWEKASLEDRKLIEQLPNFSWEVFTEISGIEKPEDWD